MTADADSAGYPKEAKYRNPKETVKQRYEKYSPKQEATTRRKTLEKDSGYKKFSKQEDIKIAIQTVHEGLEKFINPALAITDDEADHLANRIVTVADLYEVDIERLHKYIAIAALFGAIVNVEYPKVSAAFRTRNVRPVRGNNSTVRPTVRVPRDDSSPSQQSQPESNINALSGNDTGFIGASAGAWA